MTELFQPETKKPWLSKTLWANVILSVGAFIPALQVHLTPENMAMVFTAVNAVLRFATKTGLSVK